MKVVNLHPEDLLDKAESGELNEKERALLDAHLARCSTCRFERNVRADFADELDDAEPGSVQRFLALVDTADTADKPSAKEPEPIPEALQRIASVRPTARRRVVRVALLAACAAVLLGGAATAANGTRVWARLSAVLLDEPALEKQERSAPTPSSVPAIFSSATTIALERALPPNLAPAPEEPVVVAFVPARPVEPIENAGTLFEAANEARRNGDYARALNLHRRLQSSHPTSREAHVSHATVGRLLLDRGDSVGALASFEAYRARGPGALDEAAMVGRATALERLGRTDEARSEWRALLRDFPETPYAEHAKTRIEGTGAR